MSQSSPSVKLILPGAFHHCGWQYDQIITLLGLCSLKEFNKVENYWTIWNNVYNNRTYLLCAQITLNWNFTCQMTVLDVSSKKLKTHFVNWSFWSRGLVTDPQPPWQICFHRGKNPSSLLNVLFLPSTKVIQRARRHDRPWEPSGVKIFFSRRFTPHVTSLKFVRCNGKGSLIAQYS